MSRFANLAKVTTNQSGLYFKDGTYLVEVQAIKFFENRKRQDTFVVEAKVIESSNPERPPGCTPSQVITINPEFEETCWGNIKQFAGAVLGLDDPDEISEEELGDRSVEAFWIQSLEYLVDEKEKPAKGVQLRLSCTTIETRAGGSFTRHVWSPV